MTAALSLFLLGMGLAAASCAHARPIETATEVYTRERAQRVLAYAPDLLLIWQSGANPGMCNTLVVNRDGSGWYVFNRSAGWRRGEFRLDVAAQARLQTRIEAVHFGQLFDRYVNPNIIDGGRDIVIVQLPQGWKRVYGMNYVPPELDALLW